VRVLNQQGGYGRAVVESLGVASQDASDFGLIEITNARISHCMAFNFAFIEPENAGIRVKSTSAFILESTSNTRDRSCRMHINSAVTLTGEAITKTEITALGMTDQMSESLYFFH